MKRNTTMSIITVLICAMAYGAAFGQQDRRPAIAGISDFQVQERLSFIENSLYSAQPSAQAWWYSWISIYAAGTVVQESLAGVHWNDWKHDHHPLYTRRIRDRAFAEDMLVGGLTTAIGLGGQLIFPFKPAYLPDRLRAMPAGTPAERLDKLARAEDILKQCAETEKDGWGWLTHVLNIVVNAGAGCVTVFAFHRPWTDGLITFAEGEAVSLVNIFSQPRRAIRDLKAYEAKYKGGADTGYDYYDNEIFLTLAHGGIGVGMKF
ncbi:MAG: hypothetical protein JXA07_06480 [Spirochaetes bacterium]|nr:hypothetical protein [Spirochaetota bacterium]